MSSDRRVHQLRLRGYSHEAIRHGAIVVEDALRTASVPGLPQNGLLLIRRLDLGKLPVRPTPIAVARLLESRFSTTSLVAITKDAEDLPRTEAVWFRDEVAPYALLAGILAKGLKPVAWYWPKAAKGWSPRMPAEQGLRHVLYGAFRTQAGIAGATRVVEHLIDTRGETVLGRILQLRDGRALLALGGIPFPGNAFVKGSPLRSPLLLKDLAGSWRRAFGQLMPQWGPRDARTVWLAHIAVCARNSMPSTCAAAGLLQQLDERYRNTQSVPRRVLSRMQTSPTPGETTEEPPTNSREDSGVTSQPGTPEKTNGSKIIPKLRRAIEITTGPLPGSVHRIEREKTVFEPADNHPPRTSHRDGADRFRAPAYPSIESSSRGAIPESPSTDPDEHDTAPKCTRHAGTIGLPDKSGTAESDSADDQVDRLPRKRPEPAYYSWEMALEGVESGYAGFVFLVQVLEWLGMRTTLAAQPKLEALNLPIRIFWHCIDLLGISHEDPICDFLAELPTVPPEEVIDFVAPAAWKMYCCSPKSDERILTIRPVRDAPGRHALWDNNGKLVVAIWNDPMPPAVRKWIRGHDLLHLPAAPHVVDLECIIGAHIAAIELFVERYAGTDLRRMVNRSGYVAVTPTHLDVTFDQKALDIGIRKAGLDIDPGWVPWLGRVIYFHYTENESQPCRNP